jgi:hypothetical protein
MSVDIGSILTGILQAIFAAVVEYKKTQGMKDDEARRQAMLDAVGSDKKSLKALYQAFKDAGVFD